MLYYYLVRYSDIFKKKIFTVLKKLEGKFCSFSKLNYCKISHIICPASLLKFWTPSTITSITLESDIEICRSIFGTGAELAPVKLTESWARTEMEESFWDFGDEFFILFSCRFFGFSSIIVKWRKTFLYIFWDLRWRDTRLSNCWHYQDYNW